MMKLITFAFIAISTLPSIVLCEIFENIVETRYTSPENLALLTDETITLNWILNADNLYQLQFPENIRTNSIYYQGEVGESTFPVSGVLTTVNPYDLVSPDDLVLDVGDETIIRYTKVFGDNNQNDGVNGFTEVYITIYDTLPQRFKFVVNYPTANDLTG